MSSPSSGRADPSAGQGSDLSAAPVAAPAASSGGPTRVALLGSGGSIGRQSVEVLAAMPDAFRVVALATGSNATLLEEQAELLRPAVVSLAGNAGHGNGGAARLNLPAATQRIAGPDALEEIAARPDVDLVLVATGGLVALRSVLAALSAGKVVATANKETLVAGGHLVMPLARALADRTAAAAGPQHLRSPLGWLRPIDSEHSAIWQCLVGESHAEVERLFLTASGGPFLDTPVAEFATITPQMALRHPTWTMGAKITIDSATLANKGLEIIEARWLYDVPLPAISVVIHPQSVVHSAVQFVDGSIKAQLGSPDMRLPIQYALTYPARRPSPATAVDLVAAGRLEFRPPDDRKFPALRLAREAGAAGPRASTALISADEVAVSRFLAGDLNFPGIWRVLEAAVEKFGSGEPSNPSLDELVALDTEVRAFAQEVR